MKNIEYDSEIINVDPVPAVGDSIKWKLKIRNCKSLKTIEKIFDVVLVCNGHFEKPHIPKIKGIENFKGEYIHSKYYRFPEKYSNKTVFILGAKSSGLDIAAELLNSAKKVYISSHTTGLMWRMERDNLDEVLDISHIDSNGKIFSIDGSEYEADAIICCTGYEIDLNFLSDSVGLRYDNTYVRPLYKDIINPYFPSSFFIIGLGYIFLPFTHSYMQCKVARAIVQNCQEAIVISTDLMMKEIQMEKENFEKNNIEMRHRHFLNKKEWPYLRWCERVAENVMTAKLPEYYKNMFEMVSTWREHDAVQYRDIILELVDNGKLGYVIKDGPENDFYSADFTKMSTAEGFE